MAQIIKGCASQNIHTSSLRATSHALTHFTPSTCTPSSPVLVPRCLIHCEDPLPPQGGASAELPPPTGHETNRIVDNQIVANQENRHLTEDDQITELEDRVKSLSYNQSFLPSTHDSAESIATPPESDFDDEQLRALLASPLYLQERGASAERSQVYRSERESLMSSSSQDPTTISTGKLVGTGKPVAVFSSQSRLPIETNFP